MSDITLLTGDAKDVMKSLKSESVDCIITSPPYWQLRDYDVDGQLGLEPSWKEYISKLTDVFVEARRILKNTGTMFIVIGDKYDNNKNLIGLPFRLAFSMQDEGLILRTDIIWNKTNPIPAGGKNPNKCTPSHEHILFVTKQSSGYYFNADKIKEKATTEVTGKIYFGGKKYPNKTSNNTYSGKEYTPNGYRLKRDVWSYPTARYKGGHFAPFPEKLVETCLLAGCPENGTVLDMFNGGGTTGIVCKKHNCNYIGIDINPDYIELSRQRLELIPN